MMGGKQMTEKRKERGQRDLFWYRQPASVWIEALPLGNGRLGAMDWSGDETARIQIDESSFWSGEPSEDNNRKDSKELLAQLRETLLKQDFEEADRIGKDFIGKKHNYGTNMPVANLEMAMTGWDHSKIRFLQRSLDLAEARTETEFEYDGVRFCREVFLSNPAQTVVIRLSGNGKQSFSMKIRYTGIGNDTVICAWDGEDYRICGKAREKLHSDGSCGANLSGAIRLITDGAHHLEQDTIHLYQATEALFLMDLRTDMFLSEPGTICKETVQAASTKGYEVLKQEHTADVRNLYERMDLTLGAKENTEFPTDVRIQRMIAGEKDPALMAQMFQFGRYLFIASSREDSPLPTHMGGIWNDNIYNNIDCTQDMHIDMNLEMQYWLAAQCNLPELYAPFFRYVRDILIPSGRKTAEEVYGAEGWTAHVVTNPWGFTSLGWSYNWGVWSLGGAWCTTLFWDCYEYTQDEVFLRKIAWPVIRETAAFVLDYVFWDEAGGCYMTGPSYSPENRFRTGGKDYFLSLSATCDVLLVREVLQITRKAMRILSITDAQMEERCERVCGNLPTYRIGKRGQIQEWFYDFEEPIPNHRHTSHLLGMYPFWQIRPEITPELAEAVKRSIEDRYQDFEVTSWGMVMLIGYYARLQDGEKAMEILQDTVRKIVKPNMASVMSDEDSMWCSTWELDGNTGLTSVIGEMLLQSKSGEIQILPALPAEWDEGSLKGICVKGGHEADLFWKEGNLVRFVLRSGKEDQITIVYKGRKKVLSVMAGEKVEILSL